MVMTRWYVYFERTFGPLNGTETQTNKTDISADERIVSTFDLKLQLRTMS